MSGKTVRDIQKVIKAITYHKMAIRENKDGYTVRVVFDV
jgi:SHS2 domain-containing protein